MDVYSLWPRDDASNVPMSQGAKGQPRTHIPSRAPEVVATALAVISVCVFVVCIRLYTRIYILRSFALDDGLIILATCCAAILAAMLVDSTKKGMGMHIYDLTRYEVSRLSLHIYIGFTMFTFSMGITKMSIVLSYLRIFASTKGTRIACFITLAFLIINTSVAVTLCILTCRPISLFWHPERLHPPVIVEDHCFNVKFMWMSMGAINIAFDFILIALPMPVLKSLPVSRRERYVLMSIFALGGFGCICGFLRLRSINQSAGSKDPGWDNVNSARWTIIEMTVGIICASLPQCKALITRIFPGLLSGNRKNKGLETIAISQFDKGHAWHSRLEERLKIDANQRSQMRARGGLVQSTVEKGVVEWDDSEDSGETSGAAAIMVTTTLTQRRESHCPSQDDDDVRVSRNNSITPSEISLPPFLTQE